MLNVRLAVLVVLMTVVDGISICPTRSMTAKSSDNIDSPGYPSGYIQKRTCTLSLSLPSVSLIEFRVNGQYKVPCNGNNYLRLRVYNSTISLCGERENGNVLGTSYIGEQPSSAHLQFQSKRKKSPGGRKFRIDYTVMSPIDIGTNSDRAIPSVSPMYIVTHKDFTHHSYRPDINSNLTLTYLSLHSAISLSFPRGNNITAGCTDVLYVIGVRGAEGSTYTICGGLERTLSFNTISDSITFSFVTDGSGSGNGLVMKYSVESIGCSTDGMFVHAVLTPILTSANLFSLTCVEGYKTVDGSSSQTIECLDGTWTAVLPCSMFTTTTTSTSTTVTATSNTTTAAVGSQTDIAAQQTTQQMRSADAITRNALVGFGVALLVIAAVTAAMIVYRRRQQKPAASSLVVMTTVATENSYTTHVREETASTSNYLLAGPLNGKGQERDTAVRPGQTSDYMLAEPCDEYVNADAIKRLENEGSITDVYAEVSARTPSERLKDIDMVDNVLYGTG